MGRENSIRSLRGIELILTIDILETIGKLNKLKIIIFL